MSNNSRYEEFQKAAEHWQRFAAANQAQMMWHDSRNVIASALLSDGRIISVVRDTQKLKEYEEKRAAAAAKVRKRQQRWLTLIAVNTMIGVYSSIVHAPHIFGVLFVLACSILFCLSYKQYWLDDPDRFYQKI